LRKPLRDARRRRRPRAFDLPDTWALVGILTVVLSGFIGMLWTPGQDIVASAADRLALDQGWAFAAARSSGPRPGRSAPLPAGAIGSAAGGAFSQAVGALVTYLVAAAVCLLSAGFWWLRQPAATCS
jgi:hypothetical protein